MSGKERGRIAESSNCHIMEGMLGQLERQLTQSTSTATTTTTTTTVGDFSSQMILFLYHRH